MKCKLFAVRIAILLLLPFSLCAQFTYTIDQSIPVVVNGTTITNPWAGGLNSAQINTIDLDGDGKSDLAIFEKTAGRMLTFLSKDNAYKYAPDYESLFPSDINTFVSFYDYNCDGKKDLFTFGGIGILVYQNVTSPGQPLSWKKLSFYTGPGFKSEVLLTTGLSGGKINLLPGTNDLPSFVDVDGDGDMDVINMRFISPSQAEYHRNMSKENNHGCDSLELEKQPYVYGYGNFMECSCGKIAFGSQTCADIGGRTDQVQHNGGKALLAIDMDNDGDKDLVFSEETCSNLYFMQNKGTAQNADMNGYVLFPFTSPVNLPYYPAAYFEDLDFDGKPDLIASPNLASRPSADVNFEKSVSFFKNTGTTQLPVFSFSKNNFLQDNMIDVGDFSAPAFVDIDLDGDQDMFIGKYLSGNQTGSISYYQNTGSASLPSFSLVTDDYLSIGSLGIYNIKPQFIDVDKNGGIDLVFTATRVTNGVTSVFYVLSTSTTSPAFGNQSIQAFNFSMAMNDNVTLIDVDQDGRLDILRGTSVGALEYWRNNGSNAFGLIDNKYLGFGESLGRQFITAVAGDLDGDNRDDLVIGNQAGSVSVIGDFRSAGSSPTPNSSIIYNSISKSYSSRNLGGRMKPVITNLFGTDKPEIVIGNSQGGIHILKNDNGLVLGETMTINLSPNPLPKNGTLSILIDRNSIMDVYTVLGQKVVNSVSVPGNQIVSYTFLGVSPGIYIARFTAGSKSIAVRFIVL